MKLMYVGPCSPVLELDASSMAHGEIGYVPVPWSDFGDVILRGYEVGAGSALVRGIREGKKSLMSNCGCIIGNCIRGSQ